MKVRALLATILIALALFAPRRAVSGASAAVVASAALSAFGSTSLTLLGLLTLAGSLVPWRALWLYFAAFLAVLVVSPATESLALLGPHPWGGGRFYGISNEVETLLLAPALVLGLAAAPLVLVTIAWSRAGADGGGLLVYLAGYARLLPRPRLALVGALVLAVLFVAVDAATGGHSHVTNSVLHGHVFHDLRHRWHTSWHGLTGAWGRAVVSALAAAALVWVATRRERRPVVDAFLLAILVSLVANDTPQDVLFWGAIAAGCSASKPGGSITTATPETVVGTVPTQQTATVPAIYAHGDANAGKQVFETAGCKGCHTLKDAGATGTVGPNLDQAKPPLSLVVERVTKGRGAMPSFKGQLSDKQIADVAAYVVKASGGNPSS
jgi:mono/diheme cytochrome c family protein